LWLRATGGRARGALLQRMPGSAEADADTWHRAATAVGQASSVFAAVDAHAALRELFPVDDVRAFRPRQPRFGCSCSRERVAAALQIIGSAEVESILAERGNVGVDCEFCNRRYEFAPAEARKLFSAPPAAAVQ
jgi:molecular chaperone Hsp33